MKNHRFAAHFRLTPIAAAVILAASPGVWAQQDSSAVIDQLGQNHTGFINQIGTTNTDANIVQRGNGINGQATIDQSDSAEAMAEIVQIGNGNNDANIFQNTNALRSVQVADRAAIFQGRDELGTDFPATINSTATLTQSNPGDGTLNVGRIFQTQGAQTATLTQTGGGNNATLRQNLGGNVNAATAIVIQEGELHTADSTQDDTQGSLYLLTQQGEQNTATHVQDASEGSSAEVIQGGSLQTATTNQLLGADGSLIQIYQTDNDGNGNTGNTAFAAQNGTTNSTIQIRQGDNPLAAFNNPGVGAAPVPFATVAFPVNPATPPVNVFQQTQVRQESINNTANVSQSTGQHQFFGYQGGADNFYQVDQNQTGNGFAVVRQDGDVNQGFITQNEGTGNGVLRAGIDQQGAGNLADITQAQNGAGVKEVGIIQRGDNQVLEITQNGPGNTSFYSLQEGATHIIRFNGGGPIVQTGNVLIDITQTGDVTNTAELSQNNPGATAALSRIVVDQFGGATVVIDQNGPGNTIDSSQNGAEQTATLQQIGTTQNSTITLVQTGDRDVNALYSTTLTQNNIENATIALTQDGMHFADVDQTTGFNVQANLTQLGEQNELTVLQTGSSSAADAMNLVTVEQDGSLNIAMLEQGPSGALDGGNTLVVKQNGTGYFAQETQLGRNNIATILQGDVVP